MSYLSDIVQYIRNTSDIRFKDRVYMGNDINAIDTAYSDSENHKLSAFFVPADAQSTYSEFAYLIETYYFNAFIFVPIGDDVGATDGWETAISAARELSNWVQNTTFGVNKVRCLSEREFRVGRGYYIYMVSFSIDTLASSGYTGSRGVAYFSYDGETNGNARYTRRLLTDCKVDENFALSRTVNGIYRSFGCEVLLRQSLELPRITPTYKDWFVLGPTFEVQTKAEAIAKKCRVYEVNEWKEYYGEIHNVYLGMRIIGA